jgi:hypothetical protein
MLKKLLISLALFSATVAHADTWRMNINDLDRFKINCSIKEQQLVWLASQLPTPWEVFKNDVLGNSILQTVWWHYQGTFEHHQAVRSRRQKAVVKWLMFDLVHQCDWTSIKPAQCLQVTDDTKFGAATGQRCWDGQNHLPIIDRWEVD